MSDDEMNKLIERQGEVQEELDILVERVQRGWHTVDIAIDIINQVFDKTPAAVYGIDPS
jgi:hypothetical protein